MSMILIRILRTILATATPEIVLAVRSAVLQLKARARETPNPVDDILADLLVLLVGANED